MIKLSGSNNGSSTGILISGGISRFSPYATDVIISSGGSENSSGSVSVSSSDSIYDSGSLNFASGSSLFGASGSDAHKLSPVGDA